MGNTSRAGGIRYYDVVRSAHIERLADFSPAALYYRTSSYDFDHDLVKNAPGPVAQMSRLGVAKRIWRVRPAIIEVNEPLHLAALPSVFAVAVASRFAGWAQGGRIRLVSYAIENGDLSAALSSKLGWLPRPALKVALRWAIRTVVRSLDRLVFGTEGAYASYAEIVGKSWLARRDFEVVPTVPAACECLTHRDTGRDRGSRVLFVGALESRKGVPELLRSWPIVKSQRPKAELVVAGKGPLTREVEFLASTTDGVRYFVDPPRSVIHSLLADSKVLVLLSQPHPRWREQVGLPILEGLAHGCQIATSDQTGVTSWLAAHDHFVVESPTSDHAAASAIIAAIDSPLTDTQLLAHLPERDGRTTADDRLWND